VRKAARRIPLRSLPSPKVRLQYLIFPYANFSVGTLAQQNSFEFGPFILWHDTEENWQHFLKFPRPSNHLSMYVGRDGKPIPTMWIATPPHSQTIVQERWQRLSAALFYLAWARISFFTVDRPAAEDFYFEAFVLPEGAENDSSGHVRWSKYGTAFWSDIKIHPVPEVSFRQVQLDLPPSQPPPQGLFYDPTPAELFKALEQELKKPESRSLVALWFFMQACYRSASRSGFSEDIQNICTAFEALLDVNKKGDSAKQVSVRLQSLFLAKAPSRIEKAISRRPKKERQAVLKRLDEWVKALYKVRNAYTHGKEVNEYLFGERSIWQDAFEIFRLAANRTILKSPERHPTHGSALEKRLMSVLYFDEAVSFFSKKREWMNAGKKSRECARVLKETIRKTRTLDPELVESISSIPLLRQALFNTCTAICRVLVDTRLAQRSDATDLGAIRDVMRQAYSESQKPDGKLNTDTYIRKVAPRLGFWTPMLPFAGKSVLLYEVVEAFNALLSVYGNFTSPILKSLAAINPPPSQPQRSGA
jgi:hypothetical protein